jgi:hypothetical protein
MPPKAAAEVAVLASTAALVLLAEEPAAAAELLLEELELLQPAASMIDPTAAALATIALDVRKVKPSPCRPRDSGASLGILARQVGILTGQDEQKVARWLRLTVLIVAICHLAWIGLSRRRLSLPD